MRLADLSRADTPVTRRALAVVSAYASPALRNHAIRSAVWAAAHAQLAGIDHDAELLEVASLLHDLGLEEPFDNYTLAFEDAGGHAARIFAAGAGWTEARQRHLADVIREHMFDAVDPSMSPEGYLLERATALDISGAEPERWPEPFRAEVLAAFPRLDLRDRFGRCFQDQAARKQGSAAAAAVRSGLLDRLARNPLDGPPEAHPR